MLNNVKLRLFCWYFFTQFTSENMNVIISFGDIYIYIYNDSLYISFLLEDWSMAVFMGSGGRFGLRLTGGMMEDA